MKTYHAVTSRYRPARPVALLLCMLLIVSGCNRGTPPAPTPTPLPPTATPLPPTATPIPVSSLVDDGYRALAQSDFTAASGLFEQAADRDPTYAPAFVGLATLYTWQVGYEQRALELAQQAVTLAPDSAAAQTALARAELNALQFDKALYAAEQAATLDATDANVQAALATVYLSDYQYEAALAAAERAVTLDPNLAPAYVALGDYYATAGDAARAQAAYERALALQPQFAPWHIALGRLWHARGRFDLAQAALEQALALLPESSAARLRLAYLDMDRGEDAQAQARIEDVKRLIPDAPQPYVAQGYLYRLQNAYDDARAELHRALELWPNYPEATADLAYIYVLEGDCDLAIRQFQTLIAQDPRGIEGLIGMGFARMCDDDPGLALTYLRKAANRAPFADRALLGLAMAYDAQTRWQEADLAYAQALQVGLDDSQVHGELADAQDMREESAAARAELLLALELRPEDRANSAWYHHLSRLDLVDGQFAAAEMYARDALRLNPNNSAAQLTLGMALVGQGKSAESIGVIEGYLSQEPDNAYAHAVLGVAYKRQARFSEAKQELELYIKLAPESGGSMISLLIAALDEGYYLSEADALARLREGLNRLIEGEVTAQIDDTASAGRTLVITMTAGLDVSPSDLIQRMALGVGLATTVLDRIQPTVPGGVTVRLLQENVVAFTMAADAQSASRFADGLSTVIDLISAMTFKHTAPDAVQASIDEIKSDVSATRALTQTGDVAVKLVTEDDVRQQIKVVLDGDQGAAMDNEEAMLVLLGALDPTVDLQSLVTEATATRLAGYYNPEEKTLYLVDREETTAEDQATAAHEVVHALQDQTFDLHALLKAGTNADEQLAILALVEGDATLAMTLYSNDHVVLFDQLETINSLRALQDESSDAVPAAIRDSRDFPYVEGLNFVMTLYSRGDWAAVDAAYSDLPRSTEQILHPERYREHEEPVTVNLPDLATALGSPWQEVARDVMGELGLRLYLQAHVGPTMAALAADGWAGDRYLLLQRGAQGPYLLLMQTAWDDQDESDQFWALFQEAMDHQPAYEENVESLVGPVDHYWWTADNTVVYAHQDGTGVQIVIGPDVQTVTTVLDSLD